MRAAINIIVCLAALIDLVAIAGMVFYLTL
jgi:hypothetical protein